MTTRCWNNEISRKMGLPFQHKYNRFKNESTPTAQIVAFARIERHRDSLWKQLVPDSGQEPGVPYPARKY